jgi:hypothetical protein
MVVVTVSDSGAITISMFMKALKVAEAPARFGNSIILALTLQHFIVFYFRTGFFLTAQRHIAVAICARSSAG